MLLSRTARIFVLLIILLTVSCGQSSKSANTSAYSACEDADEIALLSESQCRIASAPLDYRNDNGELISLFVRKFPARQSRRGTVVLLAGGPGESGASFYADIEFFRDVFAEYDLIIPDHRGTGYSAKLCEPEETKNSKGGLNLIEDEWASCFTQLYSAIDRTHAFNMDNAAQDVATLVDALGAQEKVYLYGVSYGTSLALALAVAERTNAKLEGIILDSLTPSPSDDQYGLGYRSHITDGIGRVVLERCAAESACPLGHNAAEVYADLLRRIDSGEMVMGLDAVPNGDLRQFMGLMLDVPAARNMIPSIIAAMADNNETAGDIVQYAAQTYEAYLSPILAFDQAAASIPLTSLMSGSEFNSRKSLTPEEVANEKSGFGFTSPLPGYLAGNRFPLYEPVEATAAGRKMPPLLVLHGTLDPKTVYEAAMRRIEGLSKAADVTTITLIDAPHAAYISSKDCLRVPINDFMQNSALVKSTDCEPLGVSLQWAPSLQEN